MKPKLANVRTLAVVCVGYWVTWQLCFAPGGGYRFDQPVWPPGGLALAAVLLLGFEIWPALLTGGILAGLTAFWKIAGSPTAAFAAAFTTGAAATLEALAGAWLVQRFAGGPTAFRHPHTILLFVVMAGATTFLFGGLGNSAAARLAGLAAAGQTEPMLVRWWLASLVSTVLLTPLLLVWRTARKPRVTGKRIAEAAALLLLTIVFSVPLLTEWHHTSMEAAAMTFLLIPTLVWSGLRFGQRGTAIVLCVVTALATTGALNGNGLFSVGGEAPALLLMLNFVAFISVMSFIVAADVAQRQRVENDLATSEQRYGELFEYNPQAMWVFDFETLQVITANEAALEMYGYSREEFIGKPLPELWPPGERAGLLKEIERARKGLELTCECQHLRKDGLTREVQVTSKNLIFGGRPSALVLCVDITERNRSAKQTTAFAELSRRLSAVTTAREASQLVMKTADVLFGWDACWFELYLADRQELRTVLAMDTIDGERTDMTDRVVPAEPGAHSREALERGARLILRPEPAMFAADMTPFGNTDKPSASLMFAPVRADSQPIAILSIQSYRHHAYSESDLRLFQALADHCGAGLQRVRAEEEINRLNLELEQRVGERTAQLEAINKELEAFSYSVSHDLRAPLRGIRGFSEVLLERYAENLDPQGQEFLGRVCNSSRHMERLIEDLLKLSRLSRSEMQRQEVNLSALAEGIVEELRRNDPQRTVTVVITPELRVRGDERLLRVVLDNLLRNAWKFTVKCPQPKIEVGLAPGPPAAFFVRDNGAGFDMAYASKLFGVFQRLHSASEFPGTGVGLATVQRIINRHGGRVWAEGAVDHGAVFYFTLPEMGEHPQAGTTAELPLSALRL